MGCGSFPEENQMDSTEKINIVVAGLGFGVEFIPLYLEHPNVKTAGDRFGIQKRYRDIQEVIAAKDIDAVHLVTGIPDHAWQATGVLNSGKHCACTVPMATSLEDLEKVVAAQQRSRKNYMMMETAVYTRPFLYAQSLAEQGVFGRLQFLRGALFNDRKPAVLLERAAPMWYQPRLNPLLHLAGARAVQVHCLGSGVMRPELQQTYGNPFPIETALFQLDQPGLAAEATVGLFYNAHPYIESFVVYGENACYEWQMEDEDPLSFTMTPLSPRQPRKSFTSRPAVPDRADLLPPSRRKYPQSALYPTQDGQSVPLGGGHHGSPRTWFMNSYPV
jgi:predicted dehydrogenase